MTLLEKALARRDHRRVAGNVSDEEIELALAWLRNEITLIQVSTAMTGEKTKFLSGKSLYRIANILRAAYERGILRIQEPPP